MKLKSSSASIDVLCRELEAKTASTPDLVSLVVDVEVLSSFDELPEAQHSNSIRNTPAGYRRSLRRILVNDAVFTQLSPIEQEGVLMHEVGHAYLHANDRGSMLGECIDADLLVCAWGFFSSLAPIRMRDYGQAYVDGLELAVTDPMTARKHLTGWHARRLAGRG